MMNTTRKRALDAAQLRAQVLGERSDVLHAYDLALARIELELARVEQLGAGSAASGKDQR